MNRQITAAIKAKQDAYESAPINTFDFDYQKLLDIGYKPLKPTDEYENDDLIAATTKEKNLWIIVMGQKNPKPVGNLTVLRI